MFDTSEDKKLANPNDSKVDFQPFLTEGSAYLKDGEKKEITILRDTGANQSLMLGELLDNPRGTFGGEQVIVKCTGGDSTVPLHFVHLKSG